MKWYFDTSVFVAAAIRSHPHNSPAAEIIEEMIAGSHQGAVSGHSLNEVYSCLTRLPPPLRLSPRQAMSVIEESMLRRMELITLSSDDHETIVRTCASQGWSGGRVHDAVHVHCAVKSNSDRIYTFNLKDFLALVPAGFAGRVKSPESRRD